MLYLEGFYGQTVPIPDDRLYEQEEELWLKNNGDLVRIGVTKVGVLLMGGIETTEFFVGPGDRMEQGEEMVFFETFKAIRYVVSPLSGQVTAVNDKVIGAPELFDDDPYGEAWLLDLHPDPGGETSAAVTEPSSYLQRLLRSEHCAEGAEAVLEVKRGSPTCRSVYGSVSGSEAEDQET